MAHAGARACADVDDGASRCATSREGEEAHALETQETGCPTLGATCPCDSFEREILQRMGSDWLWVVERPVEVPRWLQQVDSEAEEEVQKRPHWRDAEEHWSRAEEEAAVVAVVEEPRTQEPRWGTHWRGTRGR